MSTRVVILGAGFGGLELSTMLSEALGDSVEVTLIDKNDAFVFGYSKLDVMFGRTTPEDRLLPGAVRRARQREAVLWLQPPRPLVWSLGGSEPHARPTPMWTACEKAPMFGCHLQGLQAGAQGQ
jgi:NADPH-dependent 2,4-dienoyl-CoA reductase/sulfur reductase-like enzyme